MPQLYRTCVLVEWVRKAEKALAQICLHSVVVRTTAALGRDPGDDLIRILDVAGFAVNTIGRVQADALAVLG